MLAAGPEDLFSAEPQRLRREVSRRQTGELWLDALYPDNPRAN